MKNEPKIVKVETTGPIQDIGKEASMKMAPGYRFRYKQPIQYTLADGKTEISSVIGMTKPKLAERLRNTQDDITKGNIFALYNESAVFVGTVVRWGF